MNGAAKNMQDFIDRLTEIVEANLQNEQFGVNELAREMGMSRSNLHRRITEAAKIPANQFICHVRLKKALKILKETSSTVSETAYECGFHSTTYFSKCFHDYYGYPPGKAGSRNEKELAAETSSLQKTGSRKRWLIPAATLSVFGLFIFIISESAYFSSLNFDKNVKSNTIAILPLKFEGSDSMRLLAGGLTEAVLNRLMEIENLVIRPKTSVQQYCETNKSLKEIAKEVKVDYIIEFSGRQYGDKLQFQINLADTDKDNYLLREPYIANMKEENFLDLQNLIAFDIIEKTKTQLLPLEKDKLKVRLTDDPAALNAYLQGLKYLELSTQKGYFSLRQEAIEETIKAKMHFEKAIQLDSAFIEAYVMLGHIYINKISVFNNFQRNDCLDSGLVMAEKAISLNSNRIKGGAYRNALSLKSSYMGLKGNLEESRRLFKESIKYHPSQTPGTYEGMFSKYSDFEDYYDAIAAFYKYIELKPKDEIIAPWLYNKFCLILFKTGFPYLGEKYLQECLNTNLDSSSFFHYMCLGYVFSGDFESCIKSANKAMKITPNPYQMYLLCNKTLSYTYLREFTPAFETVKEIEKNNWPIVPYNYFKSLAAFVYLKNGQQTLANQNFQEVITELNNEISSGHLDASLYYSHFELAMIYAAMDDKERALHYLEKVTNKPTIPRWIIINLQNHPAIDNICHEPEFAKLKKELEGKYRKEHKRIALLLRKKGQI